MGTSAVDKLEVHVPELLTPHGRSPERQEKFSFVAAGTLYTYTSGTAWTREGSRIPVLIGGVLVCSRPARHLILVVVQVKSSAGPSGTAGAQEANPASMRAFKLGQPCAHSSYADGVT